MLGGDQGYVDLFQWFIPVQLTDVKLVEGTYYYDWTEQSFDPVSGSLVDAISPRTGDTDDGPFLVELNNVLVGTPSYTWIKLRGMVGGQPFYEFYSGEPPLDLASSSSSSSSSSSASGSGSGVQVVTETSCDDGGLSVTTQTLSGTVTIGKTTYPITLTLD